MIMRKKKEVRQPPTVKERNTRAREWLKQHDLFNIAALCRRINYNRGGFAHFEEGHLDLSDDALVRLEAALNPYGYDPYLSHF